MIRCGCYMFADSPKPLLLFLLQCGSLAAVISHYIVLTLLFNDGAAGVSQLDDGVGPSDIKPRNFKAAAFDIRDPETPVTGKDPGAGVMFEEERCTSSICF